MNVERPRFLPDPDLDREEMEAQQRAVAEIATFGDGLDLAASDLWLDDPLDLPPNPSPGTEDPRSPVVVGVDQAFTDEEAVSVAVAIRDGTVVDVAAGREPLEIPYIPGLLAFREAGAIVDALTRLAIDPDLLVLDGSGRIHYRQAGIATHVGVLFAVPAIGVAKSLLCGRPERSLSAPLPEGTRVPILADAEVETDPGTVIGYAYQSRQFPRPATRHVNPLFVSPGHLIGPATTVDVVEALCAGYKLPEPTRLADRAVDRCVKGELSDCGE
ncbi:MAG: endonuclease V [Halanaeroarchaeum sp.]